MASLPALRVLVVAAFVCACSSAAGNGPTVVDNGSALQSASLGTPHNEISLYVSSSDHDASGPRETIWILPEEYFEESWPFPEFEQPPRDRACVLPRCDVDWLNSETEVLEIRWAIGDRRPEPVVEVSLAGDENLTVEVKLGPPERFEDEDAFDSVDVVVAVLVLEDPLGDRQPLNLSISE